MIATLQHYASYGFRPVYQHGIFDEDTDSSWRRLGVDS